MFNGVTKTFLYRRDKQVIEKNFKSLSIKKIKVGNKTHPMEKRVRNEPDMLLMLKTLIGCYCEKLANHVLRNRIFNFKCVSWPLTMFAYCCHT